MRILATGAEDKHYVLVLQVLMAFAPDTVVVTESETVRKVAKALGYAVEAPAVAKPSLHLAILFPGTMRSTKRKARSVVPILEVS